MKDGIDLSGKRVGLVMTGSFCTFQKVFDQLEGLKQSGCQLYPILSDKAYELDTRFFTAEQVRDTLKKATGREIWHTLQQVEPIGPKKLLDLLIVAPCTGNTLAKMAQGGVDTPASMAVKSQLRNGRPVLLAISTNDGLGVSARNIAQLLTMRHIYFVPYGQDDPEGKPASLVAHMELLAESAEAALQGKQIQPILRSY
ncbi:MAG TPA: dipicolinate synthase subunit B [Candidatus Faecaligallichristensenella faecipullorum]|nr:dipicolinate synthase subunit B [Candidatus Faecaligallichristensenella faecipullorum]